MHAQLGRLFTFVGVLHLLPLPAGPRSSPGFAAVRRRALEDAATLARGGADALIVENLGDAPLSAGPVDAHVVAFVAEVGGKIRRTWPELALGINLLRNDARAALGVAAAIDAAFIRVNIHVGSMWTDQGLIEGDAHRTLRYRRELGAEGVAIAADVLVKHAVPPAAIDPGRVAADTSRRGGADLLIVTGEGTGHGADPARMQAVRAAVPEARVWVGSGVSLASAGAWRASCHGAIVGTALHHGADLAAPLDLDRVRAMRNALDAAG